MSRINPVSPDATGKAKQLLDAIHVKLGRTPNMMKVMAQSPAALEGLLSLTEALAGGELKPELREQIAIAVSQSNGCEYCLSAHTTIGKMRGLSPEELASARQAHSADPKSDAALQFVQAIVSEQGRVTDADLAAIRQAGYTDGEITEMVANVALMIFTNYFNNLAQTKLDWPLVPVRS